jgi:hypothetical protein
VPQLPITSRSSPCRISEYAIDAGLTEGAKSRFNLDPTKEIHWGFRTGRR